MNAERNTHLLDWLSDGHTHCQHGTKEWCEAYLHNSRDAIKAQDARIAALEAALRPFADEKLPSSRRIKIAYNRHGLRCAMSDLEIAQDTAARALAGAK